MDGWAEGAAAAPVVPAAVGMLFGAGKRGLDGFGRAFD